MAIPEIDNACYDQLGNRWYTASDDPVALLRAESRLRNPWVVSRIERRLGVAPLSILDIGCGAGFLSNELGRSGHRVTAIDLSRESLEIARQHDLTGSVRYRLMDAHELGFESESFDVVSAMDFLEHTPRPGRVIEEAARMLRPGGLFFFHTFNRNPISRLVVIRGMEWFVKNTPKNLHVYELFIKPSELREACAQNGLEVLELRGVRPRFGSPAFLKMLLTGRVPEDLEFVFSSSLLTGYSGFAVKTGVPATP